MFTPAARPSLSPAFGAEQREGALDALFEDHVGELLVGQGAGELQRPDHQGVDAERLYARRLRIVGCHPAAASSMTASTPSVYARLVGSVLRAISSSRAADGQPSS